MREHHPLGVAGGAGGVHDRREVIGSECPGTLRQFGLEAPERRGPGRRHPEHDAIRDAPERRGSGRHFEEDDGPRRARFAAESLEFFRRRGPPRYFDEYEQEEEIHAPRGGRRGQDRFGNERRGQSRFDDEDEPRQSSGQDRRNLREVQAIAAQELSYPLLVQGEAPRSALLREFKVTPHAVLLATSSFWQGVDVGEQLSCVIVDKLPFASPGDPITAARIEAITTDGGDAFHGYQVPLAVLALQQGLGRLIRHREDRGVLAVLDPRLRTMAYGRRFLDSLPPAPIVHDLDEVARFFDETR